MRRVHAYGQQGILNEITEATKGIKGHAFGTEAEAALALHNAVGPIAQKHNIEIGAQFFAGQGYDVGKTVVGPVVTDFHPRQVNVGRSSLRGFVRTADFHTHPDYYRASEFSDHDLTGSARLRINGYLSAPDGRLLKFDYNAFSESGLSETAQNCRGFVGEVK